MSSLRDLTMTLALDIAALPNSADGAVPVTMTAKSVCNGSRAMPPGSLSTIADLVKARHRTGAAMASALSSMLLDSA